MKKLLGAASALALLGLAGSAFAADNATATATANVVTPLSVTASGALNFGNILQPTSACTVVVTSAAARTGGTCAAGNLIAGVTPTVPTFATTVDTNGSPNYSLVVAPSSIVNGANSMAVDTFTYSSGNTGLVANSSLAVGATLHVGSNQATGTYTGSITATATYN